MRGQIIEIISGIGILIAIYLFLSNGGMTVSIISGLSESATSMIKTLQGRG